MQHDFLILHLLPLAEGGAIFGVLLLVLGIVVTIVANIASKQKKTPIIALQIAPTQATANTEVDDRIRNRRAERTKRRDGEKTRRVQQLRDRADQMVEARRYSEPAVVAKAVQFTPAVANKVRPKRQAPTAVTPLTTDALHRPVQPSPASRLRQLLRDQSSARSIFVAAQVLGPPVALRDPTASPFG